MQRSSNYERPREYPIDLAGNRLDEIQSIDYKILELKSRLGRVTEMNKPNVYSYPPGQNLIIRNLSLILITAFICVATMSQATAQESTNQVQEAKADANEVAQKLANPNSPLASLNFKNQFRTFDGNLPNANNQSSYTLLFQPGFPFALDNGDLILWRPALPLVINQPVYNPNTADFDSFSGLGDFGFDLAYAHTTQSGILMATGVFSTIPSATRSELSLRQFTLGPEVLVGKLTKKYVLGFFPNHQWDVAGWGNLGVNLTTAQAFATWLPGGGWNIGTVPIMTYDWIDSQWTVPINLQVGRTVIMGGRPWKLSVEVNYYFERADSFGPKWMIGLNITPVIQNPLAKLF